MKVSFSETTKGVLDVQVERFNPATGRPVVAKGSVPLQVDGRIDKETTAELVNQLTRETTDAIVAGITRLGGGQ